MKSKHKIRGLTALLLASTMTLATPLTSLATNNGDLSHDASGSNTGGEVTGRGGDFSANISPDAVRETGKIGIRLSLVDRNNPSEVISVGTDGQPAVVDLLYTTQSQFVAQILGEKTVGSPYYSDLFPQYQFSTVKTQGLDYQKSKGGNGPNIIPVYADQHPQYTDRITKETKTFSIYKMAPWLEYNDSAKNYESHGTDFVNWCVQNDAGVNVIGQSGSLFTVNVRGVTVYIDMAPEEAQAGLERSTSIEK